MCIRDRDGAVYFSGLYENGLLKGVAPKDFCCWHYWGKSSAACFLGGIRLRGACLLYTSPTGTRDAHRHSRGYRRVVFFLLGVLLIVVSI